MDTGESAARTEPSMRAEMSVRPVRMTREAGWGALAALVSTLAAAWKVGAPASLDGLWGSWDPTTVYAAARTLGTQAWITPNESLGFPFAQDLAGLPTPDIVHLLVLKALAVTTGSPTIATNAFLLLGFAFVAASAYALFRVLRIPIALSFALAVSVTLVPWHFDRFVHAFLSNYSSVLLGLILVVAVLSWNLALSGPERGRPRDLVIALALACYVGLAGAYYAVFITILALTTLAFQVLLGRRGRSLIVAAWLGLLPLVVTQLAAYSYRLLAVSDAPTGSAFARTAEESQYFAGALFTLLRTAVPWSEAFPIPGLSLVATTTSPLEADAANSTIGLVAVIAAFVVSGMVLMGSTLPRRSRVVEAVGYWPWLFLTSILFFVVAGFGQAFSVLLLFQIRSWGRLAIVIVSIAYVILGLVLAHWMTRVRRPGLLLGVATGAILLVTAADLISLPPPVDTVRAVALADELRAYGSTIDTVLPPGCGVFELPAYPFPEGVPVDGTATYDPLLPYIFTTGPKWSYGGIKGTPAGDWQVDSVSGDTATLIPQVKAAGFCAIQVDGRAYTPQDSPAATLRSALGDPVAASSSGRWEMYSLAAATAGTFTADYMKHPVRVTAGFGMRPDETGSGRATAGLGGTEGTLFVVNPGSADVTGTVEFEALATGCSGIAEVTASAQGQPPVTVQLPPDARATVSVPFSAATAGTGAVHLSAVDPCLDDPGATLTIVNPRFIPE